MEKYGFIGGGNMGGALASAAVRAVGKENVLVVDRNEEATAACVARIGATAADYARIAAECRLIFLAVKPNMVATAVQMLAPMLTRREDDYAVVSMAAGVPLKTLSELLGRTVPIIRIMPNTPASVGEGMIVYACSDHVTATDRASFARAMSCAGKPDEIDEGKIDAATAVMGCGPAFVYQFIEALADGGVACGLTRAQAQLYAAQTMVGAAQMVLQTGKHPGELKDAVCSPGGSTIAGVHALEDGGLRGTVMDAVVAAYERTQMLGK